MSKLSECRYPLYRSWQQVPCCRAFNQLNAGIIFTINGKVQFANQQACFYLKQRPCTIYGRGWEKLFRQNEKLLIDFQMAEQCLSQYNCCYYMTQKSIFPHAKNHRLFKIMAFWIHPQNKEAGICWVFQDTTNLIEKDELSHYEETSMRIFELLRQPDVGEWDSYLIFKYLLEEIVAQYQLKTALYFEQRKDELVTVFAVGNHPDFPYLFDHVKIDDTIKESVACRAFCQKKPMGCSDVSQNSFYKKYLRQKRDLNIQVSTYAFPIIINQRVEGVISLYSYDSFFFSAPVVRQFARLINEICLYIQANRIKQKNEAAVLALQQQLQNHITVLEENRRVMQKQMVETNNMVTELMAAQNRAEAANRSKMNFLANVSHELRTPLNAVMGFAQMMRAETFGPITQPEYREYVEMIEKSAKHLLSLINDILDLSRMESGKMTLSEKNISLYHVLNESLELIKQYPNASERQFTLNMPHDIILYADERALKQIALNVLSNAVKFTKKGGYIQVQADVNADGVTIIFEDDGIGIPADKIDLLFHPFAQIENVLTRSHQGSGLGLVIVKKMVILHQGTVHLESEEGHGTRLIIHFPIDRVVQKQDEEHVEKNNNLNSMHTDIGTEYKCDSGR